jgi:hypothetical protein
MPSLMASLSSSLLPCTGPRHPRPRQASTTHCVHSPSCLQSLAFVFGVLRVCVHSPSYSYLWPRVHVCVCGLTFVFVFVASHLCSYLHLRPRICVCVCVCSLAFMFVFAFAALCLCLCLHLQPCIRVCVCICGLVFVFMFTVPHICVCIRSPSCSHSRPAPCIRCVHNCPLTRSHLCRVHLDRL